MLRRWGKTIWFYHLSWQCKLAFVKSSYSWRFDCQPDFQLHSCFSPMSVEGPPSSFEKDFYIEKKLRFPFVDRSVHWKGSTNNRRNRIMNRKHKPKVGRRSARLGRQSRSWRYNSQQCSPLSYATEKNLYQEVYLNPLTPKIWLLILPSSCYTFPCKLVMRIWYQMKITTSTW